MRRLAILAITAALCANYGLAAPTPAATPASIKDLMAKIVEPASNAVFYVSRQPPENEDQWKALQGQALILSEIATTLMTPARAKDKQQWLHDAKLLRDAGNAAYAAANAKNVAALEELNDQLYTACTTCHEHYQPKK